MKKLLPLILNVVTLISAQAASVNWSTGVNFDMVLEDSTGALLEAGSLAQLGYFSLSNAAIQALAAPTPSNISTLSAAFTPFANVQVGNGFSSDPGVFTDASTTGPGSLSSNQMYYWVLKSTDNSSVSTSLSTAFEQAIFYRDKTVDADWTFPTDLAPAPTVDAGDLRGTGGAIASGAQVLAGSYIVNSVLGAAYMGQPTSAIQLVPVPEPGTLAFGVLLGCAALATRRRRRA